MSNEKKQNILIAHNYYQIPGGEDTVVANEKKMLEEHGHKVILYSRNNSELNQMSKLQKLLLPVTTVINPRTYKEIKRLIKSENIEIVHVHNILNLISPAVYYAARSMKVPVVQTVHNFRLLCPGATFYRDGHICEDCVESGLWCAVKHKCYRGSRMQTLACVLSTWFHRMTGIYGEINYICLTEFNKKKLLKLKQIKADRVVVKPNFVKQVGSFIPEEKRKDQFIYAGRLDRLKGVEFLLKAWNQMGENASKLIICGTGPLEKWCKDFLANNPCNVTMMGGMPNSEVRKLIAESKGLVLPTQWYEGFPMSIVESICAGTPVVCSDLGNAGSIVKEGITGCKFVSNDSDSFFAAINRCHNLCNSTFDVGNVEFSVDDNYRVLLNCYQNAEKSIRGKDGKR